MYFPLFVGVLCLSVFCNALLCVHSSFAIILKRKRKGDNSKGQLGGATILACDTHDDDFQLYCPPPGHIECAQNAHVPQSSPDIYESRFDRRDLLAIKAKSEILTKKERPSCCEQIQKI